jgi:hemerythrin-like domain-containing protein
MSVEPAPRPAHLVDTRDMVAVHVAFRREFRRAPAVVRGVAAGDAARARVVAGHVRFLADMLHHHHAGEDRLLWPVLLARVPADVVPVVELMERQHEGLATALAEIDGLLPRWRAAAGEDDRERLAAALERLTPLLEEHLDAEEERILPLAARTVTEAEWRRLGEEGLGGISKRQLPLAISMVMAEGDPEVVREMLTAAPLPARLLMPLVGPGLLRRYERRVYGAAVA